MYKKNCYLLFLLILLTNYNSNKATSQKERVKITLYYESLCPYSRQFINDQLYPGYLKIKPHLILDLVPYGNAEQTNVNNKWVFNCQHGPKECIGNKIQACILGHQLPANDKMEFINCIMKSSDPSSFRNSQACALQHNIEWREISRCVQSDEGDQLLVYFGTRTKNADPEISYVPSIIFNGIFNATVENDASKHFLKTVCQFYINKPDGCNLTKLRRMCIKKV